MTLFAQDPGRGTTTLSQILGVRRALGCDHFFGCYAYATASGFRTFELAVGKSFWSDTNSRWLLGIDYGRTHPWALRAIAKRARTEVRIFDGRFVVNRANFVPRRDYHAKAAIMKNSVSREQGAVIGSGNFSQNGLERSVEAGVAIIGRNKDEIQQHIEPASAVFEALWKQACPWENIAETYEERWKALPRLRDAAHASGATGPMTGFWIEAGHVTKNRGEGKPGNQIFAPAGFRRYFGLKSAKAGSTLIGQIVFDTDIGSRVIKNYRENDNKMEKLTLPMPEQHGFGVYDGKVLIFEKRRRGFHLSALEASDFELAYGHRIINAEAMIGGRRFGEYV